MPAELAVILVSWNTRVLTLDALRALFTDLDSHGPEAEVWVVDNASSDGSADAIRAQFPRTHVLVSPTNLGFAGGNNHALRAIGFGNTSGNLVSGNLPRAVYLLNTDTRTHTGATRALYDALFALTRAGVVGAQLEYGDGSFQHGAFRFPGLLQLIIDLFSVPARLTESRLNGRYPRSHYRAGKPFPVDHTLGATMMLRRDVITETGLFDELYFMYCEEIDWSIRIRRAGWEIYTVPAARVTYLAGQSTKQVRPQSVLNLWRSRIRLFEQYYPPLRLALARHIVRLGMRRQAALAGRAHASGALSQADYDALLDAYQTIRRL